MRHPFKLALYASSLCFAFIYQNRYNCQFVAGFLLKLQVILVVWHVLSLPKYFLPKNY